MRPFIAEQSTISQETYHIEDVDPVLILGFQDEHLRKVDQAYPDSKITVRGSSIKIEGSDGDRKELMEIFRELEQMALRNDDLTEGDVDTVLALKNSDRKTEKPNPLRDTRITGDFILNTHNGEAITAKTPGQKQIIKAAASNDILFTIGPAGTGKTYTSVALAVKALKERKVKKIVLARPAVEAGETLGFLPGDLREKIDPYLRPLYDALEDMIEYDRLELHLAKKQH